MVASTQVVSTNKSMSQLNHDKHTRYVPHTNEPLNYNIANFQLMRI